MKKKCLKGLLILLGLTSINLFAQSKLKIGVEQAVTYTAMKANLSNSNLTYSKYSPRMGIGINVSAEYIFWKSFFISSGVSYLQKNYRFERTGAHTGWYTNFNNSYINVPVMAGTYLLKNPSKEKGLWIKLAAGLYGEYWLSMAREGRYPVLGMANLDDSHTYLQIRENYDFRKNENQYRRFGYGFQGQGQIGYSFDKFDIYGGCNYQFGLSDINIVNDNKAQKMSIHSNIFSVGAAYKFK